MRRNQEGCIVQMSEAYLVVAMVLQDATIITKSSHTVKVNQPEEKSVIR